VNPVLFAKKVNLMAKIGQKLPFSFRDRVLNTPVWEGNYTNVILYFVKHSIAVLRFSVNMGTIA